MHHLAPLEPTPPATPFTPPARPRPPRRCPYRDPPYPPPADLRDLCVAGSRHGLRAGQRPRPQAAVLPARGGERRRVLLGLPRGGTGGLAGADRPACLGVSQNTGPRTEPDLDKGETDEQVHVPPHHPPARPASQRAGARRP